MNFWITAFQHTIGEEQEKTQTNPVDWRTGGRVSKAYPNKEDGDWWATNGEIMFGKFTEWWSASGWQVWHTPQGTPGVELGITQYFGDTFVKAFIDLIAVTPDGELVVADYKTGSHMPDTNLQLGLYAVLIEKTFDLRPSAGYFYDARNGVMMNAGPLDRWTYPVLTELFTQFDKALAQDVYLPNLGLMCKSCGVKDYCYAYGGTNVTLDPLFQLKGK